MFFVAILLLGGHGVHHTNQPQQDREVRGRAVAPADAKWRHRHRQHPARHPGATFVI